MQSDVSTLTRIPARRSYLALPSTSAVVVAASAVVALLWRYTREDSFAVRLSTDDGDAPHAVRVSALLDTTLGAIADEVRLQLGTPHAGRRVRVSWADADERGRMVSIVVHLDDMTVDLEASRQRGILAARDAMSSLARHFHAVARAFATRRSTRLADVSLLDESERRHLRHLGTAEIVPELETPGLLHDIFVERARRMPDNIAVRCEAVHVSYAELDARADHLAAVLRSRGIGPGSFVALRLPRSVDVYVALLGVLKSGAAYVPIDPEYPRDRVAHILADSRAALLLTVSSLVDAGAVHPCPAILLDGDVAAAPTDQQACPARTPSPNDIAYVIYTSGSTGKPKGVAIEHRSAVHLVRAEQWLFGIVPSDRVFQGFSIAFDAAVEEVWLAFAAGASLVVGTKDLILSDLARHLTDAKITVFSTVPTLLASIDADLPTVRLLIVGGEACPQALVEKWATPARAMFNTYGPTEATVIATYAHLHAGEPVTIGRPIPNYQCHVVDRAGHLAPAGVTGEIVIGGVGLARGYVGAAELTASRFVACPFASDASPPSRIYKTGDLGRFDDGGNIEFLGRIDDQVKLRGFRIELGEVEAALLTDGAVSHAAAMVREDVPGQRLLIAYVVARAGERISEDALKRGLPGSLPPYMIPARVVVLDALPTLASGKVDRRALPVPSSPDGAREEARAPRGALESTIARSWSQLLGVTRVARDQDFFLDLGGHSLLAAQTVSELRRLGDHPQLATLSVLDVYEHPTIERLAARLARGRRASAPIVRSAAASRWRYYACAAAQAVGLYGIFGAYSFHWLAPYLAYVALRQSDVAVGAALVAAATVLIAVHPLLLFVALAAKWIVIGRYRPGRHRLWGAYYFRYWLVDRLLEIAPTTFLVGTPLLGLYYRLLGARIGSNVHLASDNVRAFDVVAIDDDATLGVDASARGCAIEHGELVIGAVRIGKRCVVGARSVHATDTTMHDDATLGELSLLTSGSSIPGGGHWSGSPAREAPPTTHEPLARRPSGPRRALMTTAYAVAALLMPVFIVAALLPGLFLLNVLERHVGVYSLAASPIVAASFVMLLCLEIAFVKWALVGRSKAGRYHAWSGPVFRLWLFDRAMTVSLDVLGGLYATLLLNPWYRLLGVRVGKNAEVSTASSIVPDLLHVGDDAFIADSVSLGTPLMGRGWVHLEETRIGVRTFIGNSAVVSAGTSVGDDCLVGCLSAAPRGSSSAATGASWFGSPPISLPQRQKSAAFPASATYRPARTLVAQRLAIEALRVTLPTTCFVALTCLLIDAAVALHAALPLGAFLAAFPLLYVAFGIAASLVVVATKWIVMGRFQCGERPLWSTFVWRNELVTAMHENLADPFSNELLRGTPFAAWFFRALGAKIGRRVYLGTTQLTEYDLITVGDDVSLDADCTLQTHLFEDRVMKMSTIAIEDHCSVGAHAVVLYDTRMERGSRLAPLSLLMKGETLPERTSWEGSPAQRSASR